MWWKRRETLSVRQPLWRPEPERTPLGLRVRSHGISRRVSIPITPRKASYIRTAGAAARTSAGRRNFPPELGMLSIRVSDLQCSLRMPPHLLSQYKGAIMRRAIVYLCIALLVGILTLQNRQGLVFHVFFWTVPKVSSSLVIIASVLLGAIIGASVRGYSLMKNRRVANSS